ncbi:hypothetical protein HPB50_000101 [Hyalomma asiaticum]|uniref:Uncharacterized protein n=1 Tax=Hyalomma asiaticum TaxID=266040 RepID=A0ACB7SUG0_HYAAI|nr:hypothetical protein HPB50_000101 [Hyalomma asiaticum]
MMRLMTVMYFTLFVVASASAFKLAKEEGSVGAILGSETSQAGMDTAFGLSDATTFESGTGAKEFQKFDDEAEEYFVGEFLQAIKKLGEDLAKSLGNVRKHFEKSLQ